MDSDETSSVGSGPDVWELLTNTIELVKAKKKSPSYQHIIHTDSEKATAFLNNAIFEADSVFRAHQDFCIHENKGRYWYLLGTLYNISINLRPAAIEFFERALKLDPSMVDAWNDIGEAYWLSGKKEIAKSCFQSALSREKNKVTYRNLSLIARQEASDKTLSEHKHTNLMKGINLAKEAIKLDASDGESWSILGNAYLTQFFLCMQDVDVIEKALHAYTCAERTESAKMNPELHYNKGVALNFKEAFKEAIDCFNESLKVDPTFSFATQRLEYTIKYLNKIKELSESKGKIKEKKLQAMLRDLAKRGSGINERNMQKKHIADLATGKNLNSFIEGKVLWSIQIEEGFPFTFGLIDANHTMGVVSLFNLAKGKGVLIGDTVAIKQPMYEKIDFTLNEQDQYTFLKVRINCPLSLIVNKKPVNRSWQCAGQLTTLETE